MAFTLSSGIWLSLNNSPTTATIASGGASGSTSVVITTANSNILEGQSITGSGFAANTKVSSVSGTTINFSPAAISQISGTITFSTTWYKLTDHNRSSIDISSTLIEKESRMANGMLRKYVVSKKDTISTSWEFLPAKSNDIVDGFFSSSWLTAFYNANHGLPIYIKLISARHSDPAVNSAPDDSSYLSAQSAEKIYNVFITSFNKTILKRTSTTDYVNMDIEFTEI